MCRPNACVTTLTSLHRGEMGTAGVAQHDAQRCEPLFTGQCGHDVLRTIVGILIGFQHGKSLLEDWVISWPCLNLMWARGEVFVACLIFDMGLLLLFLCKFLEKGGAFPAVKVSGLLFLINPLFNLVLIWLKILSAGAAHQLKSRGLAFNDFLLDTRKVLSLSSESDSMIFLFLLWGTMASRLCGAATSFPVTMVLHWDFFTFFAGGSSATAKLIIVGVATCHRLALVDIHFFVVVGTFVAATHVAVVEVMCVNLVAMVASFALIAVIVLILFVVPMVVVLWLFFNVVLRSLPLRHVQWLLPPSRSPCFGWLLCQLRLSHPDWP